MTTLINLTEVRAEVARAEAALALKIAQRDEAIRAAIADGASVADLADAFGLTRSRVYQIRDGRR